MAASLGRGRARSAILVTVACALLWPRGGAALEPGVPLSQHGHDVWQAELPQSSGLSLAQTKDGYLWVGTEEGVGRFDGARWVSFDPRALGGTGASKVAALAPSPSGLWVGTDQGLCLLAEQRCAPVQALGHVAITSLLTGPDGVTWVGTAKGLYRIPAGRLDLAEPLEELAEVRVRSLGWDPSGAVMIGTARRGLARLAGEKISWITEGLPLDVVDAMVRLPAAGWVVATRRGLFRIEGARAVPFPVPGAKVDRVSELMVDREGTLWIATLYDGFYLLRDGRVTATREPWSSVYIRALLEDREGNIWVGTHFGGVHRLRDTRVRTIGKPEGLKGERVDALLERPGGDVWVGTLGAGLACVGRGPDGPFVRWQRGSADGLPGEAVVALAEASLEEGGGVWVGTTQGAVRVDDDGRPVGRPLFLNQEVMAIGRHGARLYMGGHTGLYVLEPEGPRRVEAIPDSLVSAISEGPDGTLWVGLANAGVWALRGAEVQRYGRAEGLPSDRISAIVVRDGRVWVGTFNGGVAVLEPSSGRVTVLGEPQGIGASVAVLALDARGDLYACGNRGIDLVPAAALAARLAGEARIVAQHAGREDGMRSIECISGANASLVTREGQVWLSTTGGVATLPAAAPAPPRETPPVFVEEVLVDGQVEQAREGMQLRAGAHRVEVRFTAAALRAPERLRLRYQLDGVERDWQAAGPSRTATYTSLSPGRHRLAIEAGYAGGPFDQRTIFTFTVAPRVHQTWWFRALALMALSLAALGAHRVRLLALKARQRALEDEVAARTRDLEAALHSLRATQDELVRAERLASIATLVRGIAHELNNPIGFIAGNLEPLRKYVAFLARTATRLAERWGGPPEELTEITRLSPRKDLAYVVADLERIAEDMAEGTRRARLIVGDLQGLGSGPSRAAELVDVAKVVQQTLRLFEGRRPQGVSLSAKLVEDATIVARAGEVEQVMVNLVDNALRAVGEAGRIEVTLGREGDALVLAVKDSGVGMPEEVRAAATRPFFTTRAPGEGSGLGLSVVSSIAAHHRGQVEIDSAPGAGTTVRVALRSVEAPAPSASLS